MRNIITGLIRFSTSDTVSLNKKIQNTVNNDIKEGWQPYGHPTLNVRMHMYGCLQHDYFQTMVKYQDDEIKQLDDKIKQLED